MKKQLLKSQDEISEFFKELGVDYGDGLKYFCGQDIYCQDVKNAQKIKEYKIKEDDRVVEGYATTPHVDWVKDSVTMEAIEKAAKHLLRKGTNTVFLNHNQDRPVGKVISTLVDKTGLFISVLISKAKDVEDIWTKVKEGIISSFSIRFIAKAVEIIRDNDGGIKQWNIKEMEILEVSLAPLPMNPKASVTNVIGKSMKDLGQSDSNHKYRSKKMKSSNSKSGAITEIVKELVETALDSKLKTFGDEIKAMFPKTKAEVVAEEAAKAKAVAEEAAKAKATADAADKAELETLRKENKELKEKGTPKGEQGTDGKEKSKKTDVVKALENVDDEATCTFVLKAMDDEAVYNGLTAPEKDKCKQLYFQMLKTEKKI